MNLLPTQRTTATTTSPTAPRSGYARPALPPFGVGYGRSSGYVRQPSYVREWGPARFGLR